MKNRTKAWLYQAPAILLLLVAFIASFYLAATGQLGINWGSVLLLGIILVLFLIGKYYDVKMEGFY